jgi:geranylgeranyl pyrophosphate synthase
VAAVVRDGRNDGLVREVVAAIRESGAIAKAMDRARDFITRSQAALAVLPESETQGIMSALADYTISRRK